MTMNIDLKPLEGRKILCALSGGADSMCLLHYLHTHGIELVAAHFEHGIRGKESLRDAEFVESYCKEHNIPCVVGHGDVPAYAKRHRMSMEEAARELRYEFLKSRQRELGCAYIVTAHNMNDNAETVLFNLSRGSGAAGLAGIPRARGCILRPLLDVSRAEIEEYMEKNAVPYVTDSTNLSNDYTRNLIRHELIPLLEGINPRFIQAAGRTATLMQWDNSYLTAMAGNFLIENKHEGFIPCSKLVFQHPSISGRALRILMPELSMEHVETILSFCAQEGYGELNVPGRRLVRDQGLLYYDAPIQVKQRRRRIKADKRLRLSECGLMLICEICDYMGEVNDLFKTSYLKYEIINSNLRVGPRENGDKLRPLGRGLSKTLKALFVEAKYPQHRRELTPVIRDDEGPLWVYGLALDERAVPQVGEKALKITFRKINSYTGE